MQPTVIMESRNLHKPGTLERGLSTGPTASLASTRAASHAAVMPFQLPSPCRDVLTIQCGVISRKQAIECGLPPATVDRLVRTGRWLTLRRGVYTASLGEPSREATLWAATLRAGPGAALSHQTAAELHGLYDQPSTLVHVSVPEGRHIAPMRGVVIHRSVRLVRATQANLLPPRTRIEETVLDLAQQASAFDAAFAVACAACQRRLTTPGRLRTAMAGRGKLRWRCELTHALAEIDSGVHSLLEYRYVRRVEQPHGLPRATRQAKVVIGGRTCYLDNLYGNYGLCVELDGRQAHPDDRRWLDVRRDNAAIAQGLMTLRYGWTDVSDRSCLTAAEIGVVLASRGWPGSVRPCGPRCAVATRRALAS